MLTRSPQISGQNKSEAREPEGLVKITYGIVASSIFKMCIFIDTTIQKNFLIWISRSFKKGASDNTISYFD